MTGLHKILHPTDFSDYSAEALEYACLFAEKFSAELHVLHVFEHAVGTTPVPGAVYAPDYFEEMRRSTAEALSHIPDPEWAAGRAVEHVTRQGTPFAEIIKYSRENEIDLIVLGTHGRAGLGHLLIGSVAEKVARKAPCPVLTVRPRGYQFAMP